MEQDVKDFIIPPQNSTPPIPERGFPSGPSGSGGGLPAQAGNGADSPLDFSANNLISVSGYLEILMDYGILRAADGGNSSTDRLPRDVYISASQIRRFDIRVGDLVSGLARPPKEGERYLSLIKIEKIQGLDPEKARSRPRFEDLTPVYPYEQLKIEVVKDSLAGRLIDLFSPIGKGQRGMIVSPPKAGKTFILKDIAKGISQNHPEVKLLVALIAERPEEVTDIKRSVKGEVYSSNFDETAESQTRVAEVCLEKAKRMAESGEDVVILLDSITRLARAYNLIVPPSGRTLSGGFDPVALYPPKHFFGAARAFDPPSSGPGGSLTILATALIDTGSRMDDLIFEEFKGTGNLELHLDRRLSERRIFPAIDIRKSGTRNEELLYDKKVIDKIYTLRRMVDVLQENEATELIIERLKKTETNKAFLDSLNKG